MTHTKIIYNSLKYKIKHFLNPKMIKPKQKTYEMLAKHLEYLVVLGGGIYGVLILKLDQKIYEELKGIMAQMDVT